jgi:hypothetical protein
MILGLPLSGLELVGTGNSDAHKLVGRSNRPAHPLSDLLGSLRPSRFDGTDELSADDKDEAATELEIQHLQDFLRDVSCPGVGA